MSNSSSGDWTCDLIQEIKRKADDVFLPDGGAKAADYVADVAPILMIKDIQKATFSDLTDPTKDTTVKITFPAKCDVGVTDCTTDCTVDGEEAGSLCKDYELNICFESDPFAISEKKFRTLGPTASYAGEWALNLLAAMKAMDEELAARGITFLHNSAGANANTTPYTVAGDMTSIPATAWNPDLFGYFAVTRKKNRMPNMNLLLGGLMEQYFWKIENEANTPEGQSAARKVGSLGKVYSDMFVTEATLNQKAAFLVNPSSVAFASKAYFTPYGAGRELYPTGGGKTIQTTIPSYNIPGVVYDAVFYETCADNDVKRSGKLMFKGGLFLNPLGCTDGRTGVLEFECV